MSITTVVGRGFGPSASIPFVVTRGYSIGAASVVPPNATLTTRGYGANATIAGVVTRFYGIGAPIVVVPPPPAPSWDGRGGGPIVHRYRERREELRRAYAIIRRHRKKLPKELQDEVLTAIVYEDFPDELDVESVTQRAEDFAPLEDLFARAIVEAELPEPEPAEYAPLVALSHDPISISMPAAPDSSWTDGLFQSIARMRRIRDDLADDDEEVLLLLS